MAVRGFGSFGVLRDSGAIGGDGFRAFSRRPRSHAKSRIAAGLQPAGGFWQGGARARSMAHARHGAARGGGFAVGDEGGGGHLPGVEIFAGHGLHLGGGDVAQALDQARIGVGGQAQRPVAVQLYCLAHDGVTLVNLAGDPLGFHALQLGFADAVAGDKSHLL